jgi:hypothetical protein
MAIRPRWAVYLGSAVEPVVAALFRSGPLAELVPFEVAYAGRSWSARAEFDLVMLDETRRRALVVEIKWTTRPVTYASLRALASRVAEEPALSRLDTQCAVVSRHGFRGSKPGKEVLARCIEVHALDWGGA